MKKIVMFNYRDAVEGDGAKVYGDKYGVDITCYNHPLNEDNYELTKGFEAVSIVGGSPLQKDLLDKLASVGVKYISTRSIGYDHIDVNYAKSLGMRVANNAYSPSSVGDFAVTLMLMLTRKLPLMLSKSVSGDHSMNGVKGVEMHNLTIGIIGGGKIGRVVAKRCYGFDSKVLIYDKYENEDTKKIASYVDLDTLLKESDIISVHVPYNQDTHHLIDETAINKMKDGVYIINTARGELISNQALIKGLLSGKIQGAGLDVMEQEQAMFRNTTCGKIFDRDDYYILRGLDNVILTPHKAFLTDEATNGMVENSITSLIDFIDGKENFLEIK